VPGTSPYGSWPSPITAELLVERAVSLSQPTVSGDAVYWLEGRPAEGGRQVVVRWVPGQEPVDVVPPGFSARSTVHEYGGGDYAVHGETVFFSNFDDQRLYRIDGDGAPTAITPVTSGAGARYADADVSPDGTRLACVRERHLDGGQVVNDLVSVPADGSAPPGRGRRRPRLPRRSPLQPGRVPAGVAVVGPPPHAMGGTDLSVDGDHVAGGPDESVSQPRWSPDGVLHWVSDLTGWWNLYAGRPAWPERSDAVPLAPVEAEFTRPDWVFGQSTYAFLPDGRLVAAWLQGTLARLSVVDRDGAGLAPVETPYTTISALRPTATGSSPSPPRRRTPPQSWSSTRPAAPPRWSSAAGPSPSTPATCRSRSPSSSPPAAA